MDYYWALVPEASPIAIPVEGSLSVITFFGPLNTLTCKVFQAIMYGKAGKAKKPKKEKKPKDDEAAAELTRSQVNVKALTTKQPAPTVFTIQVGFGLQRIP